jgi:hypothetical protein
VQLIQTHALLAVYFYHTGRVYDGRYHTGAAAALALQCGLHQMRSEQPPAPVATPGVRALGLGLPPPEDAVEEGERINAFWTVYAQDHVWAVVLGVSAIISDAHGDSRMQVDTPWPLDMAQYECVRARAGSAMAAHECVQQNALHPDLRSAGTLRAFFDGASPGWQWETDGVLAQLSKASALFERATRLAASWQAGS